ncbi:MAG: hypothetical protein QOJ63_3029, partial [Solirubrobacteraceae bacterium]|nr:hypothetical protein [Solirubrobacteraceae bacterium]
VAYRGDEETMLGQAREAATGDAGAALEGLQGARSGALEQALGRKQDCKSTTAEKQARVANQIESMYETTKADVETILGGLDKTVDDEFTRGEEAARTRFENDVDDSMRAYKRKRYHRLGGSVLWLKDKIAGLPDEVNEFYTRGRADYFTAMDAVIEGIASTIGTQLTAARARIVEGRAQIHAFVQSLDGDLRVVGEAAESKLQDKFDALTSDVDSKQDKLVDAVARRYVESRTALDTRIEELQADNKGLVAAAFDAVVGVVKTIIALGEMLLRVLAKAAEVVGDIISDPIGFLGNLVEGVMGGLRRFVKRISVHLQNALAEWLFGSLGGAGITLPAQLDGAGVLDLVTQVVGLTYANIRERVARVVGEGVVAEMEQTVDVFKMLAKVGVGGLWEFVKDRLADIEETVLGKIKEYVVERVIKGGIEWIIGLLTPVGAFIKACKAIYSIVMFIVDRAKQVIEFVDAILDSISAIAKGDLGTAMDKVEDSLAKGLPLAIGFLAGLLNIGNLSEKVKSIIAAVRRPIDRAIDGVVMAAARAFKPTFGSAAAAGSGSIHTGGHVKGDAPGMGDRPGAGKIQAASQVSGDALGLGDRPGAGEREPFDADGLHHEVFSDPAGRIMVASTDPRPVAIRLQELGALIPKNLPRREEQTRAKAALTAAGSHLVAAQAPAPPGKPRAGVLRPLAVALRQLYELLGHPSAPPTAVSFSGSVRGEEMLAQPLTRLAGNTQGASATGSPIPADPTIVSLNAAGSVNWVKMHLLSARLHGPDVSGNFTPGTQASNNLHYTQVEAPLITKLESGGGRSVLWYFVKVHYRPPPHDQFPERLDIQHGDYDMLAGRTSTATSGVPVPPPGAGRTLVSLSEDGEDRLHKIGGLSASAARTIGSIKTRHVARLAASGGKFRSWEQFLELALNTPGTAVEPHTLMGEVESAAAAGTLILKF